MFRGPPLIRVSSAFHPWLKESDRDIGDLETLLEIGAGAGLEREPLRKALTQGRHSAKVLADERLAAELGLSGVPALLIYRPDAPSQTVRVLSGAQPYERVRATVESVAVGVER